MLIFNALIHEKANMNLKGAFVDFFRRCEIFQSCLQTLQLCHTRLLFANLKWGAEICRLRLVCLKSRPVMCSVIYPCRSILLEDIMFTSFYQTKIYSRYDHFRKAGCSSFSSKKIMPSVLFFLHVILLWSVPGEVECLWCQNLPEKFPRFFLFRRMFGLLSARLRSQKKDLNPC